MIATTLTLTAINALFSLILFKRDTEVLKNHGVTITNSAFLIEADKATEIPDKVKRGTT